PAVARLQRVGVLEREMHQAVTRAHCIPLEAVAVVLNGDPVAGEHVEDLLLRALEMQRRAPTAGLDRDAPDADCDRVGARQRAPRCGNMTPLAPRGVDLVPVGDHATIMSRASADRSRAT